MPDALLLALVEAAKVVLACGGVEGDFFDGRGDFAAFWKGRWHGDGGGLGGLSVGGAGFVHT